MSGTKISRKPHEIEYDIMGGKRQDGGLELWMKSEKLENGYQLNIGRNYKPFNPKADHLSSEHGNLMLQDGKILYKDHSTNGSDINSEQGGRKHIKNQTVELNVGDSIIVPATVDSSYTITIKKKA